MKKYLLILTPLLVVGCFLALANVSLAQTANQISLLQTLQQLLARLSEQLANQSQVAQLQDVGPLRSVQPPLSPSSPTTDRSPGPATVVCFQDQEAIEVARVSRADNNSFYNNVHSGGNLVAYEQRTRSRSPGEPYSNIYVLDLSTN